MRAQRGFALVEVMVAAAILAVGVLGVLAMIDAANATTGKNKLREGATNLAREVIENVDALPYSAIDPSTLVATLQSKPQLANAGGGASWVVVRRGVSYTVTATVCNIDDPRDGAGTHDASFCSGGTAAGTTDGQPVDYKRVTVTTNSGNSAITQVRQSTLMFPSGNTTVASVTNMVGSPASPITSSANTSVSFTLTTDRAPTGGVEWFIDDNPKGTASGSGTSWSFTWPISSLPDGTYVVSARAYNSSGAYGAPYQLSYTLNRNVPLAPTGFNAGWNPADSSVDAEWLGNTEGDILGYHVWRQQTSPTTGSIEAVNCGTAAAPVYLVQTTSCTDATPLGQPAALVTPGAATTAAANNSTSLTLNKPVGVAAGDVMVAAIGASGIPIGTWPSGWNFVSAWYSPTATLLGAVFYKVATASEPASYTFTSMTSQAATGGIQAYSNVDTSNPFDGIQFGAGISGNAVSPSLTTTQAYDRVIQAAVFGGSGTNSWVPTVPGGSTLRLRANSNANVTVLADSAQAVPGATGTFTTVPNGTDTGWVAHTIALRPASQFKVNYWVTAVDRDPSGNLRDSVASTALNAYAPNNAPSPPTWATTPLTKLANGSTQLAWNLSPGDPDSGDSVAFYRIYRDGQRYDTTGTGTDTTYVDSNPGGTTHSYVIRAVDTHEAESSATSTVTG